MVLALIGVAESDGQKHIMVQKAIRVQLQISGRSLIGVVPSRPDVFGCLVNVQRVERTFTQSHVPGYVIRT